jgi:uncharacterized repeat protein (TIGR03803 family)
MTGERPLILLLTAFTAVIGFLTAAAPAFGASKEKVLHSFQSNGRGGQYPTAGLIFDSDGNLYGTTAGGGAYDYGTVFRVARGANGTWTETVLHSFDFRHGAYPYSSLVFDAAGNLYGTTLGGGDPHCLSAGCGTVFELRPKAGGGFEERVLYRFYNGKDGLAPYAGVILDATGNLYGTTFYGGADGVGTVFELTPSVGGGWRERVLHNFNNNGKDGYHSAAGLIMDAAGNLYGTTTQGGTYDSGTVFQLTPTVGGSWTEKVLYSFNNRNDGFSPYAGLVVDAAGNLYGMALYGGAYHEGTVFELMPQADGGWTETVLHDFGDKNDDGALPGASLTFDAVGNLYGPTVGGGTYGYGTVFKLTPRTGGGWSERVLHSFNNNRRDGTDPSVDLIFDSAGNLYGTTYYGGSGTCNDGVGMGCGSVFEITP